MTSIAIFITIGFFLFGGLIGSFLNVVAIRVLKKESIAFPPSHCVHCHHDLKPKDLIPIISYLCLRGKCRYCHQPIAIRYPLGELCAGILFVVAYLTIGFEAELIVALWFISVLIVITQTDLEQMIIPNSVVLVGLIGAIGLRLWEHPYSYLNHGIAIFVGSGILLVLGLLFEKLLKREAMGGGDIKLYTFIGAVLGIQLTVLSLFAASVLGLMYALVLRFVDAAKLRQVLPFGPFIAGGSLLVYLWGEQLLNWYMNLLI